MLNSTVCEFVTLLNNVFTFETDAEEYFRGDHVNLKSLPEVRNYTFLNLQKNTLDFYFYFLIYEGTLFLLEYIMYNF